MSAPGLLLLVDLDGVLYRGAEPVPGVGALLTTRAALGDDIEVHEQEQAGGGHRRRMLPGSTLGG